MGDRTRTIGIRAVAVAAALVTTAALVPAAASADVGTDEYTVLAADNVGATDAVRAIEQAGGTVVGRTDEVGLFQVVAARTGFAERAAASPKLTGAAHRTPIGTAPNKP